MGTPRMLIPRRIGHNPSISALIDSNLVPSLDPQTLTLRQLNDIAQPSTPSGPLVRHRQAILVPHRLTMLAELFAGHHDWHRALGDKIVAEAAQKYALHRTTTSGSDNDEGRREKVDDFGDHVAWGLAVEDLDDYAHLQACFAQKSNASFCDALKHFATFRFGG